jgi:hypothetical protein
VDTCKLDELLSKDVNCESLIRSCKEGKIQIIICETVYNEYCYGRNTGLIRDANCIKSAIQRFKNSWENSPHLTEYRIEDSFFNLPEIKVDFLKEELNKYSTKHCTDLLQHITVLPHDPEHAKRVWQKYFNWNPPFNVLHEDSKPKEQSKKRRQHIPDAWIIETAIDLKNKNCNFIVYVEEDHFCRALESHGIDFAKTAEDANNKIHAYLNPSIDIDSPQETGTAEIDNDNIPPNNITPLTKRVLAAVHLFSPIHPASKTEIISLLKKFEHPENKINATLIYLTEVYETIKHLGDGYIPRDKERCKEAFDAMLPEFTRVMSEGH